MYSAQIERITKQLLADDIKNGLLPIPENLISLRRLCHMPNTDVYDVELAAAKEPSFAAYILKLANSALYGSGKIPCENLVSVIKRIGIHSVSQYAFSFALKKCHEQQAVPNDIASLLHANWRLAWGLSQEATQLYTQHRLTGCQSAKKIDISDILMLGILQHTGRLAVLSDFNLQSQCGFVHSEEEMRDSADKLNVQLLPLLFSHWGLADSYSKLFKRVPEHNQALHAIDYLFAAALLKAYPKQQQPNAIDYNVVLATFNGAEIVKLVAHLSHLQILKMEDLNLESIMFNI